MITMQWAGALSRYGTMIAWINENSKRKRKADQTRESLSQPARVICQVCPVVPAVLCFEGLVGGCLVFLFTLLAKSLAYPLFHATKPHLLQKRVNCT